MYPPLQEGEVLTRTVFCLPAWRGRGYESQLLVATGSAARRRRASSVRVAYLDTTNAADMRVFQAAGYAPSGQERVDSYRLGRYSNAFRPVTAAVARRLGLGDALDEASFAAATRSR